MSSRQRSDRKRLIVIVAGGLLILAMTLGVIIPLISGMTGGGALTINAEGVYIYDNGEWRKQDTGGNPWVPKDNGTYLIYFKNLECSHCRVFDPVWIEYIEQYSQQDNLTPVEIVCTWFTQQCKDDSARASFAAYASLSNGQFGSPWLVLIYNQSIIYYYIPPLNDDGEFSAPLIHDMVQQSIEWYYNPPVTNSTETTVENSTSTG